MGLFFRILRYRERVIISQNATGTEIGLLKNELEAWVDSHREEIIREAQAILRIPSVEEKETVGPNAPFGRPIADALEHTLSLCERLGMRTENFGGYAGHAEFGEGEE